MCRQPSSWHGVLETMHDALISHDIGDKEAEGSDIAEACVDELHGQATSGDILDGKPLAVRGSQSDELLHDISLACSGTHDGNDRLWQSSILEDGRVHEQHKVDVRLPAIGQDLWPLCH